MAGLELHLCIPRCIQVQKPPIFLWRRSKERTVVRYVSCNVCRAAWKERLAESLYGGNKVNLMFAGMVVDCYITKL